MKIKVKQGRWHFNVCEGADLCPHERWSCSACGGYTYSASKYCPECGAKMLITEDELLSFLSMFASETVRTFEKEYLEEKGLVEHG